MIPPLGLDDLPKRFAAALWENSQVMARREFAVIIFSKSNHANGSHLKFLFVAR